MSGSRRRVRLGIVSLVFGTCAPLAHSSPSIPADVEYDEGEAVRFFRYALASFCSSTRLTDWDCGSICTAAPIQAGTAHVLGSTSFYELQGYVAALPAQESMDSNSEGDVSCVVAFRGSVDALNWLADFEAWAVDWPPAGFKKSECQGCQVHHGFMAAYLELRPGLLKAVQALGCRRASVVGHSLGGGLATLAVMDLRSEVQLPVDHAYTYGCPRVGNPAFARAFAAAGEAQGVQPAAWRIIHYRDPVPHLQTAKLGYEHFPREVFYTKEDSSAFKVCSSATGEDPACAASIPLLLTNPFDHTTYLNLTCKDKLLPKDCTSDKESLLMVL